LAEAEVKVVHSLRSQLLALSAVIWCLLIGGLGDLLSAESVSEAEIEKWVALLDRPSDDTQAELIWRLSRGPDHSERLLQALLGIKIRRVRRAAIEAAGLRPTQDALTINKLVLLWMKDSEYVGRAIIRIGRKAVPGLVKEIRGGSGGRWGLIVKLGVKGWTEAVPVLLKVLRDSRRGPLERSVAARSLGQIGERNALVMKALGAGLESKEVVIRVECALGLIRLGQTGSKTDVVLAEALRGNYGIQETLAQDIGRVKSVGAETIEALKELTRSSNERVRIRAAGALLSLRGGRPGWVSVIVQGLEGSRRAFQAAVSEVFKHGPVVADAHGALHNVMAASRSDAEVLDCARAIRTIGRADERVLTALRKLLRSKEPETRLSAAWLVYEIEKNPDTIRGVLQSELRSTDWRRRERALSVISGLGKDAVKFTEDVKARLKDKVGFVRDRAARILSANPRTANAGD